MIGRERGGGGREIERDRQRDRQTDWHGQTDGQVDRQTDRQTESCKRKLVNSLQLLKKSKQLVRTHMLEITCP